MLTALLAAPLQNGRLLIIKSYHLSLEEWKIVFCVISMLPILVLGREITPELLDKVTRTSSAHPQEGYPSEDPINRRNKHVDQHYQMQTTKLAALLFSSHF
jgi:hypothetical protein